LAEFFERAAEVLGRDADTGVADAKLQISLAGHPCKRSDCSPGRRELDGIGKKIEQNLFQRALVAHDQWKIAPELARESATRRGRLWRDEGERLLDQSR